MTSRAKTVRMPLYDGSLSGMTNLSDSAWERGKMYTASRESINKLISCTDCKKYGVYLLLSSKQVCDGQTVDLARCIRRHLADKVGWTQAVLMTTASMTSTSTISKPNFFGSQSPQKLRPPTTRTEGIAGRWMNSVRTNWISISTKP